MNDQLPELLVEDAAEWRAWLAAQGASATEAWLVLAKKGPASPTRLTYSEALEEALCHGWIDGRVQRRDEGSYRQRFTPRRPRSAWSRRNVQLAEKLIAAGRMQPAGLAAVERARADGRWESAYAGPADIEVPEDLAAALAGEPRAHARGASPRAGAGPLGGALLDRVVNVAIELSERARVLQDLPAEGVVAAPTDVRVVHDRRQRPAGAVLSHDVRAQPPLAVGPRAEEEVGVAGERRMGQPEMHRIPMLPRDTRG